MKFNTAAVITLLISASNVAASLPIVNLNLLATAVLLGKVPQASGDQEASSTFPFVYIDIGNGRCYDSEKKNFPSLHTKILSGSSEDP